MFITNEVVRIAWFGVANVLIARFSLSMPVQWGLWVGGVMAAFVFALAFHTAIDQPIQTGIKTVLARRRRDRRSVAPGAEALLEP